MSAPVSPRRRRLRWTVGSLSVAALLGLGLAWSAYHRAQPVPYRPDESSGDITSELARSLPSEAPEPAFTDVTRAAGLGAFRNFAGPRGSELPEDMGPGVAWGDFDNDGDEDLLVMSAGGSLRLPEDALFPCVLYENLGDGTFRKVASFPDIRIHGMGAAWGDYDGDGFLDLVLTGYNALILLHNEGGSGRFTRDARFPNPPGFWSSATWGDFDNDRALDLYVCGYVNYVVSDEDRQKTSRQIGTTVPFTLNPASFHPGTNLLFRNNRDGTFTEVGTALQVGNPQGRSLGGLWHDFDDDGWLDLYVANDISDNVLYHNLGGRFEDISHPALVADYRSAMGLAAGDFDRDGDDDLFVAHWVAQENALYENTWVDFHRPSTNRPAATGERYPLRFFDIADRKGLGQIALSYVGWGCEFADFDQDGWLDLVVANGSTIEEEGPAPRRLKPQELFLFWNRRGEDFHNLAPLHAGLRVPKVSRGLAVADYDGDGDLDFVVADLGEGVRLFRNDMARGHWLKVRLRSRNHLGRAVGFGDGAKVIAWLGPVPLRRTVTSVSYLSQSSHTVHFGLGSATAVDRVEVRWLGGGTNLFTNLAANATWELTEGSPEARRLASGRVAAAGASATTGSNAVVAATQRQSIVRFWELERGAMTAMKTDKDYGRAIGLFRQALELNPAHEDSRYYLASCLAAVGENERALAELAGLRQLNPQSHRAWQQWGVLRALTATSPSDLAAAEDSLKRAQALNPEETGALLAMGEVALLRGDHAAAEEHLAAATQTNPKAAVAFFLRGWLALQRGDEAGARQWLSRTREALGADWHPQGTTSEGDVARKQHEERTPLGGFCAAWNGDMEPRVAYTPLKAFLDAAGVRYRSAAASSVAK